MKGHPVYRLLLLLLLFDFAQTNDVDLTWSNWSPCSRLCGKGIQKREKICSETWCVKHLIVEEQICGRNCATDTDVNRSECFVHDSNLPFLYNYGTTKNPSNFPSPYSPHRFCQGRSGPYLTIKSGSIPYTLWSIEFQSNSLVQQISIRYKLNGYSQWLFYPSTNFKSILPATYIPYYLPKVQFLVPLQGVEFQITIENAAYYFGEFCYQVSFRGCHLPVPAVLTFGQPTYKEHWLTRPFTGLNGMFTCVTTFLPFYYTHMHIVNLADDSLVTNNNAARIHSLVLQRNDDYHSKKQVVGLAIKFNSLMELHEEFSCFEKNGLVYCLGSFVCNGKTTSYDGVLYGHFDPGYLTLVYAYDIDECNDAKYLPGCSSDSSCVNTNGSFCCHCHPPLVGDGFTCHTKDRFVKEQLGPYFTKLVEGSSIPDFYCRGVFYSRFSKTIFVCSRYHNNRPYGCLLSTDLGGSWEQTHARLDLVFGENLDNGRLYGYSTIDKTYVMFLPNSKRMYSIPRYMYEKNKPLANFHNDKILQPRCDVGVHRKRDEHNFPLETTFMNVSTYTFAMTTDGIMRQSNGSIWIMKIRWNDMPVKTN